MELKAKRARKKGHMSNCNMLRAQRNVGEERMGRLFPLLTEDRLGEKCLCLANATKP